MSRLSLFIALAASSAANVEAAFIAVQPTLQTPTFSCSGAGGGGTISWPDGISTTPMVAFAPGGEPSGPVPIPYPNFAEAVFSPLDCQAGEDGDTFAKKKPKGGSTSTEYIKITMTDILVSSRQPGPVDFDFGQVFEISSEGALYRSFWNISFALLDLSAVLPVTSLHFVGIEIISPTEFVAGASIGFSDGTLGFVAPYPGGEVRLYSAARIPEPSSIVLLGMGLLGIGASMRRGPVRGENSRAVRPERC